MARGGSMHIAMLSAEYPPRWGGMGSTVFHLSTALVALGHRITIITRNGGSSPPPEIDGVEVRTVSWARIPMAFTRSYGKSALKELRRLHSLDPVDIVHLHCPMISWTKKQFEICKQEISPIVSSLHGSWLGERDGLRIASKMKEAAVWANPNDLAILIAGGYYAGFERDALHGSTVCVANSVATKQDFIDRYSPPSNWDCEVIHWGVDTNMFTPESLSNSSDVNSSREIIREKYGVSGEEDKLLLAVGRLAARKGYASLLRSFSKVMEKTTGIKLVIVGRGHLRKRLEKLAVKLGIGDSVIIESGMSFDDLALLFRTADLVVYPSYYEGQGLIPLEAMASGTPVVTVDHGPLPEMVDEEVGSLFSMGDLESMAHVILDELQDKELLLSKGKLGRSRVLENFTYEKNAERFSEIYKRIS
jgi:glycosyltransferase involved in cell wall biosynthesis